MKKILPLLITIMLIATGCGLNENILNSNDPSVKKWGLIEESAESSVVRIALDSDDPELTTWLNEAFTKAIKLKYNVTLVITEQTLEKTHEQLSEALKTESEIGYFDLVFFEKKGFKQFYTDGMLYGPFVGDLPLYQQNINPKSFEWQFKEGISTQHAYVPIGRNQLALIYNRDVIYEPPTRIEMLWDYAKEFKGAVTYPDPRTSEEGKAFLMSALLANQDIEKLMSVPFDKALFSSMVAPALKSFVDIKPYLFEKGEAYPATVELLDDLFFNEAVIVSMSFDYDHAMRKLQDYAYPEGAATFVFDTGTHGTTQGFSIPYNAPNKSGALVVLNAILDPQIQMDKYNPKTVGQLPIFDPDYVSDTVTDVFKAIKLKPTAIKQDVLLANRIKEIPTEVIDYAVLLWTEAIFKPETDVEKP